MVTRLKNSTEFANLYNNVLSPKKIKKITEKAKKVKAYFSNIYNDDGNNQKTAFNKSRKVNLTELRKERLEEIRKNFQFTKKIFDIKTEKLKSREEEFKKLRAQRQIEVDQGIIEITNEQELAWKKAEKKISKCEQELQKFKSIRLFLELKQEGSKNIKNNEETITFEKLLKYQKFFFDQQQFFSDIQKSLKTLEEYISLESDTNFREAAKKQQLLLLNLCKAWIKNEKNYPKFTNVDLSGILKLANGTKSKRVKRRCKELKKIFKEHKENAKEYKKNIKEDRTTFNLDGLNQAINSLNTNLNLYINYSNYNIKNNITQTVELFSNLYIEAFKKIEMDDFLYNILNSKNWQDLVVIENHISLKIPESLGGLKGEDLNSALQFYDKIIGVCLENHNYATAKAICIAVGKFIIDSKIISKQADKFTQEYFLFFTRKDNITAAKNKCINSNTRFIPTPDLLSSQYSKFDGVPAWTQQNIINFSLIKGLENFEKQLEVMKSFF